MAVINSHFKFLAHRAGGGGLTMCWFGVERPRHAPATPRLVVGFQVQRVERGKPVPLQIKSDPGPHPAEPSAVAPRSKKKAELRIS
jgi:hypothetical protein